MEPISFVLNVTKDGVVEATEFSTLLPSCGIYVMSHLTQIIRVGESSSGMSRLKKGFRDPLRKILRGKERKNYIAYSWRGSYQGKAISVDYFELKDTKYEESGFRRSLEAELTFQFRVAKKAWPAEMSEIHFLERFRKDALLVETATAILKHYGIEYDIGI